MSAPGLTGGLLSYIEWNVGPELLHLGPLTLRWYGLFFALLFWIGYFMVRWQFRVEGKSEQSLGDLLTYLVAGTLIGARLGHCLFYEPGYYLAHPLEILMIWQGGLASHGGAAGVLIALYVYSRRHPDQPYLWLLDRIVVPTAIGGSLIRLGNLFNSEIYGPPTTVPWAFKFMRIDATPRHPAQLYEAIAYALVFALLFPIYSRLRSRTPRGLLLGLFLLTVFSARFVLEFFKERQATYEQDLPISVGQWLSIPFVLAGAVLLWRALRTRQRQAQPPAAAV
jgi:phosphatidylglycerol---prolipoprotein diacylglyceryl transferase